MILRVFSVYDSAAQVYSPPFLAKTIGLAHRMFEEIANDRNTSVGKYPADHTLFDLGVFEDTTGTFELLAAPVKVSGALEVQHEKSIPEAQMDLVEVAARGTEAARTQRQSNGE